MQYLVSVVHDQAGLATPDEMAAIDVFNDRLQAQGHWVFAGGLASPDTATVIDNRGGQAMVTDGPFLESKEYLAGFWVIEAPDLDVALKLATEGSRQRQRLIQLDPATRISDRLGRGHVDLLRSRELRNGPCDGGHADRRTDPHRPQPPGRHPDAPQGAGRTRRRMTIELTDPAAH
jgi:hypothetical protein